jgi:adenylyltransferase/sulfurtransferase
MLDLGNSRYHRQELITWWDQARLKNSRVLVVGAGALGNEVCKNLSLVGVGQVHIVDMDTIEHSNLARCVFFRQEDEGSNKAEVLARAVRDLNPDVSAEFFDAPVQRLGAGFLMDYDLVIGALDNREARAWVNQACRKLGLRWIDGAIEGLRGVVRVFGPEGACYMCTLGESDFKQMSHRKSCALLAPDEIVSGKTPTNATTAAVVAAVQAQEAIKYLVGREDLASLEGKGWVYTGDSMDSYTTSYRTDEFCIDHDFYETIEGPFSAPTLAGLADQVGISIADVIAVDFEEDLITINECKSCVSQAVTKVRSAFNLGEGVCATCGEQLLGATTTSLSAKDELMHHNLLDFQLGKRDIVTFRTVEKRVHVLVEGEQL